VDLSIVIVNWNTRDLLRECLGSIFETVADTSFEVIVVDNGSSDGSAEMVRSEFPTVQVIANTRNLGFARANNQAIRASRGDQLLLLNSDAALTTGAATHLMRCLSTHPEAAAAGARLVNPDGSFQWSFANFPSLLGETILLTGLSRLICAPTYPSYPEAQSLLTRPVDWVSGACMMIRRVALDSVGLLDAGYFMYTEETDWCFRATRAGWRIFYVPDARVIHGSGQSAGKAPERKRAQLYRSKLRFFRKHFPIFIGGAYWLAVGFASALKLGVWELRSLVAEPSQRPRISQHVRSYAALLNEW
jgi:hypothetical protein